MPDSGAEDHQKYYRKLLELDQSGARAVGDPLIAIQHGLESTFNEVIVGGGVEGDETELDISQENQQFILDTMRTLTANCVWFFHSSRAPKGSGELRKEAGRKQGVETNIPRQARSFAF